MANQRTARAAAEIVHAARQVAYDHRRGRFPSAALSTLETWCRELDIAEGQDAIERRWRRPCRESAMHTPHPGPLTSGK